MSAMFESIVKWFFFSFNEPSPRKELLHNIDPLERKVGDRMFPDSFDNRIRAAIRVGHMKLLTGHVGKKKILSHYKALQNHCH